MGDILEAGLNFVIKNYRNSEYEINSCFLKSLNFVL